MNLRASASPAPPVVEVRASEGSELLRLIGVLISAEPDVFDIGADRVQAVRAQVRPALLDRAHAVGRASRDAGAVPYTGDDKAFLVLALLGALAPSPGGIDDLLELIRGDMALPWRVLLAHYVQDRIRQDDPLLAHIIAGEPEAIEQVRAMAGDADDPLSAFVTWSAEEYGAAVLEVVEAFAEEVWPAFATEAMGPIARDATHRREQLDGGVEPATVVLEATNGFELSEDPPGRRVVLLPSYWFRPWLVIGYLDGLDIEVISTSVADEFLALPSEAPPPGLLKIFKALSDEGRLKLLRRMSTGPMSLGEATAELDVTKATAHHHLSILRQAGLVSLRGEGRATRYTLRADPAELIEESLAAYTPPRR